jgi:hypothetical protein
MDELTQAGQIALRRAVKAWCLDIVEPVKRGDDTASAKWIDSIIRTPEGLDWSWLGQHDTFESFEWCGAFAAHAWASVDLDIRRMYFSSTSRLDAWARYQPHFGTNSERKLMTRYPMPVDPKVRRQRLVLDENSTPDMVSAWGPRPGDILIVGAAGSKMGTHITIVDHWDEDTGIFSTVEGNARGTFPAQTPRSGRQGVVMQRRKVGLLPTESRKNYHARRIIRPSILDIVGRV